MKWLHRIFARRLPRPIAVTFTEGGEWQLFPLTRHQRKMFSRFCVTGITVHSIMFDDGNCWDAVNGWRGFNRRNFEHVKGLLCLPQF